MVENFSLADTERRSLYRFLIEKLETFYGQTASYRVSPPLDPEQVIAFVRAQKFEAGFSKEDALAHVINGLEQFAVHTPHPGYFGLFNPRPSFPSILADLITAVFNPQMAAWSHAPFAVEVENYLIHVFGLKFGYEPKRIDGVFGAGGAEANLTALLCALNHAYPHFATDGLIGLSQRPVIYCSFEAHHSIAKASSSVGLGLNSVVNIPVDKNQQMSLDALIHQIQKDQDAGRRPLMVVGTAGTTGSGSIDDLERMAQIARRHGLWFHVDAAWGGAAILSPKLAPFLKGIGQSDSITCDAHKWLSVPMGASLFLTCHPDILGQTFRSSAAYMPKEAKDLPIVDPFSHSIQWSRRFIGLKLYLSLLCFGWEGYTSIMEHQHKIGQLLQSRLVASNWSIKNASPLPIVCFTDEAMEIDPHFIPYVHQKIIEGGKSWISVYPIGEQATLRACITNFATTEKEIDSLVTQLDQGRAQYQRLDSKFTSH